MLSKKDRYLLATLAAGLVLAIGDLAQRVEGTSQSQASFFARSTRENGTGWWARPGEKQWHLLASPQDLAPDTLLRSPARTRLVVQLPDDRQLTLEADTVAQLRREERGTAVVLINGTVEVSAPGKYARALWIEHGRSRLDVRASRATIATAGTSRLQIDIWSGKSFVHHATGVRDVEGPSSLNLNTETATWTPQIVVLSPRGHIYHQENPRDPLVPFRWTALPRNSEVRLWMGADASSLQPVTEWLEATHEIKWNFPRATTFAWKLTARIHGSREPFAESAVRVTSVLPVEPAMPRLPLMGWREPADPSGSFEVHFEWQRPRWALSQNLEVAEDPQFRIVTKSWTLPHETSLTARFSPGRYFWRVVSIYEGRPAGVASADRAFEILPPPPRVQLGWRESSTNGAQFELVGRPQIPVPLAWRVDEPELVHHYRVILTRQARWFEQGSAPNEVFETSDPQMNLRLTETGNYQVLVEALGHNGLVIGSLRSDPIAVEQRSLIAAPKLVWSQPSRSDTRVDLKWSAVPGAREYWVSLRSPTGLEIQRAKFNGTETQLRNLAPGEYRVSVEALDEYGRKSQAAPAQVLRIQRGE